MIPATILTIQARQSGKVVYVEHAGHCGDLGYYEADTQGFAFAIAEAVNLALDVQRYEIEQYLKFKLSQTQPQ